MSVQSRFTYSDFRELCFSILDRASWSLAAIEPGRQSGLELAASLHDRRDAIRQRLKLAGRDFEPVIRQVDALLSQMIHLSRETPPEDLLLQVCHLALIMESGDVLSPPPESSSSCFHFASKGNSFDLTFEASLDRAGLESMSDAEWAGLSDAQRFLAAVSQMCKTHRDRPEGSLRVYPLFDTLALERATQLVERGIFPPRSFAPIQTSQRRPFQTYLSLADPGPGHLEVTVRDRNLLRGTIVHIEYIDRGKIAEKSLTEAYRIPSIRHVARIRLVVGDTSPCTVYIGRPTFESKRFENDILKSAHTIAAACSAMFSLGIADCKIAMDGMTASETIQFMRAVSGNAIRDRSTQRLSAAFNLNTTLTDDRIEGQNPIRLAENYAIAKCSIDLTRLGGFDKVTWDGAADGPSLPLIPNQLTELKLLDLVHQAHSNGLETYISAGMDADNMRSVTAVGVGGVGIGTKLHFRNPSTLAIGRVNADEVRKVLANRDFAATQPPGKAAEVLARLDWFFHDLHQDDALLFLRRTVQDLRTRLFESLKAYWEAATDGARIATHAAIQDRIRDVEQEFTEIRGKMPQEAVPSSWKPYSQILGTDNSAISTRILSSLGDGSISAPIHPAKLKAMFFIAAVEREAELRANRNQMGVAPLISPDRITELRQLIDDDDLPGIQSWFLT